MKKDKKSRNPNNNNTDFESPNIEIRLEKGSKMTRILISDAKCFVNYLPNIISLKTAYNTTGIYGDDLICNIFSKGKAEILGNITKLEFIK